MKYTFIVNPQSRSGRGKLIWNLLKPELKKKRLDCDIIYTQYKGHATEIAARVTADGGEHTIVGMGGDGSVNEIVNGIQDCSKVILGFIPTGSGNDFTRALHIPTDPKKALYTVLTSKRIVPLDVGSLTCGGKQFRFAVSAGIGYDASVCHVAESSKTKRFLNKLNIGSLIYLVTALKRMFQEPLRRAEVTFDDGETRVYEKVYFVAGMNHPYEGGGFQFCPDAKTDDGCLDVIVVYGIARWKIPFILPTALKGKHVGFKGVEIVRCRKVSVEMDGDAPLHTDGQPIAVEKRMEASVLSEQIRIILPEKKEL